MERKRSGAHTSLVERLHREKSGNLRRERDLIKRGAIRAKPKLQKKSNSNSNLKKGTPRVKSSRMLATHSTRRTSMAEQLRRLPLMILPLKKLGNSDANKNRRIREVPPKRKSGRSGGHVMAVAVAEVEEPHMAGDTGFKK